MTITALGVIADGYARINRLSPGETLGADETAYGFDRLNILVDELSAGNQFLYRDILTSASVTGSTLTLGTGSWSAIPSGAEIISAVLVSGTAGNVPLARLTMQQYNERLALPSTAGLPSYYAHDGLSTVYLYPVPTAQTIQLQTRVGVASFADQTTAYTVPPGYRAFLGAEMAVRLAPSVLGGLPPGIAAAAKAARKGIGSFEPAVIDVYSFARPVSRESILLG